MEIHIEATIRIEERREQDQPFGEWLRRERIGKGLNMVHSAGSQEYQTRILVV